jgi:hypothetical protein
MMLSSSCYPARRGPKIRPDPWRGQQLELVSSGLVVCAPACRSMEVSPSTFATPHPSKGSPGSYQS